MEKNENKYVCVGHCCHDKLDEKYILGGTCSYAAIVAKKLGQQSAVLTSVGKDFLFKKVFADLDIPFYNKHAEKTTVFQNKYYKGFRTQHMFSRAQEIVKSDIPNNLCQPDILHLCLIANELDFKIIKEFEAQLVGAAIQGALRTWDKDGLISYKEMDWKRLKNVDIVILSEEDIEGRKKILSKIAKYVDQVVLTKAEKGAHIFYRGGEYHFPSYNVKEVDATGAGDVFATAYLIKYNETKSIEEACIYAHCTASFIVEGIGLENLPSEDLIQKRILEYKKINERVLTN